MNVYWVDGGQVERVSYDPPDYEVYYARGIFCAETREQARYDATRVFHDYVDYTSFRTRLLARDLDLPRGELDESPAEAAVGDFDPVSWPEPFGTIYESLDRVLEAA